MVLHADTSLNSLLFHCHHLLIFFVLCSVAVHCCCCYCCCCLLLSWMSRINSTTQTSLDYMWETASEHTYNLKDHVVRSTKKNTIYMYIFLAYTFVCSHMTILLLFGIFACIPSLLQKTNNNIKDKLSNILTCTSWTKKQKPTKKEKTRDIFFQFPFKRIF